MCAERERGEPAVATISTSEDLVRRRVRESLELKQRLLHSDQISIIAEIGRVLVDALRCGGKVLLFGNGGSAADAQHIAAELVGKFYLQRAALPAIALTLNSSSLTAIGNDSSFDVIFSRQVEAMGMPGDVAVGISTSGNSENVIRALQVARAGGLITIALTGQHGGRLKAIVDYCICVPSEETPRIQECHILIGHVLCEVVERMLFGEVHAPR